MKTVAVIGRGKIGAGLIKELPKQKCKVKFALDKNGVYRGNKKIDNAKNYKKYIHGIDCIFLAISTFDDGKIAFDFIKFFVRQNIPIITCEKGALFNYYLKLKPFINKIGYSATVGGGTRLLEYIQARHTKNFIEISAVVNGTLNFIFDEVARGKHIERTVAEAVKCGYAEPGATTPLEIINTELRDVLLKSVILFNTLRLSSKILKAKNIKLKIVSSDDLKKIIQNQMKCVVSISKHPERITSGFHSKNGQWYLSAGFKKISDSWLPSGVNNALFIKERGGHYLLQGPGAGVEPTVLSMIQDAKKEFAAGVKIQ